MQVFQVGIIEIKAPLYGAIRHASLAFQEGDDLVKDIVECHGFVPSQQLSPSRSASVAFSGPPIPHPAVRVQP